MRFNITYIDGIPKAIADIGAGETIISDTGALGIAARQINEGELLLYQPQGNTADITAGILDLIEYMLCNIEALADADPP